MLAGFKKWAVYGVLTVFTLICLSAAFLVVSILYGMSWSVVTPPPLLGNRPDVIEWLTDGQSDARSFSFLVVGDTRSSTIFENFYLAVLADTPPDFGIILGDFVANPEMNRHRFFMGEFCEWNMTFPVFLVAGNHDIVTKYQTETSWLRDPVYRRDFEKLYGPSNFSFTYKGCLFIGLNDVYGIDYLNYLTGVLSHRPLNTQMTFVFMHIAPRSLSPMLQTKQMEGEAEFVRLMEAYGVDYVFAGDFHSYFRADKGHTKYIVTGGGGSTLHGKVLRRFHHALLMTVEPSRNQVDEVICYLKPVFDPGDEIETCMICAIYPVFEGHPLAWVAVFSFVLAMSAGLIIFLILRIIGQRGSRRRSS